MNSHSRRGAKRQKRNRFTSSYSTSEEESILRDAMLGQAKPKPGEAMASLPYAPVFYPTIEEMEGNPLSYVAKIRPIAQHYGICKIVPPKGWNPPFCADFNSKKRFSTKRQLLHRLQEGISFGDGEEYNGADYQQYASKVSKDWKARNYPDDTDTGAKDSAEVNESDRGGFTPDNVERDYWEYVENRNSREMAVEYGNDVDTNDFGSGFPMSERGRSVYGKSDPEKMKLPEPKFGTEDYYKETWWNICNMPWAPGSVLRHVKVGINGINVPWLYYGSLFTTFCWHNEDNYLYSINYHHKGAPKQWYGVPGTKRDSDGLEKVFKNFLSMKMRDVPDLLHHITTMFSPRLLEAANVPVYKTLQHAGEFVVTFPRAFHGGFSMGPNIGEAVNFATPDWVAFGSDANERYRAFARPSVFSHDRLAFTMANHLQEQKSYSMCKLLLDELERIVEEELGLRNRLIGTGVRDVSDLITLPVNRLDQLDDASATYDDLRLCHACKHVCFFSAVACECSQSKVSCLRHSHYMCRCPTERRYLMIWSNEEELTSTLERVKKHCARLKDEEVDGNSSPTINLDHVGPTKLPPVAVGVERDLADNRDVRICLEPFDPLQSNRSESLDLDPDITPRSTATMNNNTIVIDDDDDDDSLEVIAVHPPKKPVM